MAVHIIGVPTLSVLKNMVGDGDNIVIIQGKDVIRDGGGRLYSWDATSTAAEDSTNWNVVQCTGVPTGRWLAIFTKVFNLPHGTLFIKDGKKEFYTNNTVVSANSDCLINLTLDNTTDGVAIFSSVLFDDSKAIVDTSTPSDAVSSCRKVLSTNLKQLTHLFFRGNSTTLGATILNIAGAVITGQRTVIAGTKVVFKIDGV